MGLHKVVLNRRRAGGAPENQQHLMGQAAKGESRIHGP